MKRSDTPEYRAAYELGWRYSHHSGANLDYVDGRYLHDPRYDAILDGYLDYAAGRDKWHMRDCPDHDACGRS